MRGKERVLWLFFQKLPRPTFLHLHQHFRPAVKHQMPAIFPAVRPQVNDPIRRFDDLHVVLHDEHDVAIFHEDIQGAGQLIS